MNAFIKSCLVIIILLLAVIALRPIVSPQQALAANQYLYRVVIPGNPGFPGSMEQELDKSGAQGWELVAVLYNERINQTTLIFRK
jgi:hypothetical protein